MRNLKTAALVLVVVGGLNWGLVGLFDYNLVTAFFGVSSLLTTVVYTLVGLSALYVGLITFSKGKK